MPVFRLKNLSVVDASCVVEVGSLLSKNELLSTLKRTLNPLICRQIECIQFFVEDSPLDALSCLISFATSSSAQSATRILHAQGTHQHSLSAYIVSNYLPGYAVPRISSASRENFPIITMDSSSSSSIENNLAKTVNETSTQSHVRSIRLPSVSSQALSLMLRYVSKPYIVVDTHGFVDKSELVYFLRQKVAPNVPILCVQIWRARSSQALHAYVTFSTLRQAQWAVDRLDGSMAMNKWTIQSISPTALTRYARVAITEEGQEDGSDKAPVEGLVHPPDAQDKCSVLSSIQNTKSPASSPASITCTISRSNSKLVFAPSAVIIPFYATILPALPPRPPSPRAVSHRNEYSRANDRLSDYNKLRVGRTLYSHKVFLEEGEDEENVAAIRLGLERRETQFRLAQANTIHGSYLSLESRLLR